MKNNLDPFKDLKELFKNESDGESLENLLDDLGVDLKELEKSMVEKIKVNYTSESENELFYNYDSDSGFDLYSNVEITIPPLGRELIPTGVRFDVPENYEIQIRSKSGLAINRGIMVLNSPGTVDQGYTGEIKVILFNASNEPQEIKKGMKVAQAVLSSCLSGSYVILNKIESIRKKDRNDNGFGSTGA